MQSVKQAYLLWRPNTVQNMKISGEYYNNYVLHAVQYSARDADQIVLGAESKAKRYSM